MAAHRCPHPVVRRPRSSGVEHSLGKGVSGANKHHINQSVKHNLAIDCTDIAHLGAKKPRFYVPNWLARPIMGDRRFMTLPTVSLIDEVQFRGIKALHKPGISRFICTGDLTPYLEPVTNSRAAKDIAEIIAAGFRFRETNAYRERVDSLEEGVAQKFHARHFQCRADIDEYFEYQVRLIRSIAMHGCRARRDLSIHHRSMVPEFSARRPREHDIGCAIGPNGETWMFRTGHHRLHIARQFGIEQIPVEVHFVHWRWIAKHLWENKRAPITTAIAAAVKI